MKESAREAEALRQSVASGERVVELDPALIDAAPIADRFARDDDRELEGLVSSIRESGQQVPVLVRPHPTTAGRWQAAYGHRRIRASRLLGRPVRAIVRPLSDAELAIAQGKENLERRDLSFIEKAFFAAGLDKAGFDRATIGQALGADRADVSRYLAVARAIPEALAFVIGPAPKTGRARWLELAELLEKRPPQAQPIEDLVASLPLLGAYQRTDSDGRFRLAMARLTMKAPPAEETALVSTPRGQPLAVLKGQGKRRQIILDEQLAPGFAAFVGEALPDLYRRWRDASGDVPSQQPE